MALTQITTGSIADDAVTTDKLANAINTARDANTAKTTNATHSGEVTGATALTIADNVVDEANLKVSNSPTNGYFLSAQSGNTGGLTWAAVNTDLVNDTSPQLGGDLDSNDKNILIGDTTGSSNNRIKLGDGGDLQIYHNGSHATIDTSTGELQLATDGVMRFQATEYKFNNAANTEKIANFFQDGACELYHNHSKKLETTSSGINVTGQADVDSINCTGELDLTGHLDLNSDSHRIKLGLGDDLQIYHDGSNNYIYTNNGDLNLQTDGDDVQITAADDIQLNVQGNEVAIKCIGNGQVELYYDNSKTFNTIENGASMGQGTHKLLWPNNSNSNSRSFGFIGEDGAYGKFELNCSNGQDTTLDETCIRVYANGGVELFHDDSKKLETTSGGVSITGSLILTSTLTSRHITPNSNNTYDLGGSSYRYRNIYTNDLNLSNEGGSNDVDGTWGSYTIQEGAEDLFLVNKRNGKKYKFNLTEVS